MGDPCISGTKASRVINRHQSLNGNSDEIQELWTMLRVLKKKKTIEDPHFWKRSHNLMNFITMKTTRFSW